MTGGNPESARGKKKEGKPERVATSGKNPYFTGNENLGFAKGDVDRKQPGGEEKSHASAQTQFEEGLSRQCGE